MNEEIMCLRYEDISWAVCYLCDMVVITYCKCNQILLRRVLFEIYMAVITLIWILLRGVDLELFSFNFEIVWWSSIFQCELIDPTMNKKCSTLSWERLFWGCGAGITSTYIYEHWLGACMHPLGSMIFCHVLGCSLILSALIRSNLGR